jgi:hypothetical protein
MKAGLPDLVLGPTTVLFPEFIDSFRQNICQVFHLSTGIQPVAIELCVGDVKGRSMQMGTVLN